MQSDCFADRFFCIATKELAPAGGTSIGASLQVGTRFTKILVSPAIIARFEVVIGAGGIGLIGVVVCK